MADQAVELIETHGPSTTPQLGQLLAASGATHARDPEATAKAAVRGDRRLIEGEDGRFYSLFAQLEGAYLIHRMSDFERDHRLIVVGDCDWLLERVLNVRRNGVGGLSLSTIESVFDLPAREWDDDDLWSDDWRSPPSGTSAESTFNFLLAHRWQSVAISWPGLLEPLGDREYLSLKVCHGSLEVGGLGHEDFDADRTARAARLIGSLIKDAMGDPRSLSVVAVLTILATESPELLRQPLPPLEELVAQAGMAVVGSSVDLLARPLPSELLVEGVNDHYYDHMTTRMTATNTKATLLALLDRVEAGEEIEITRHGQTVARLVPATGPLGLRGSLAGVASTLASDEDLFSTGVIWDAS